MGINFISLFLCLPSFISWINLDVGIEVLVFLKDSMLSGKQSLTFVYQFTSGLLWAF